MNPIDDLFREGLSGRAGEVPADMWSRIDAGKAPPAPEGEGIDQLFAGKLADRAGEVPADMWARIAGGGGAILLEGAEVDQAFADKLKDAKGAVPAGMWQRIWQGVTAPAPTVHPHRRWLASGLAALLLLTGIAWWQLADDAAPVEETSIATEVEFAQNEGAEAGGTAEIVAASVTERPENTLPAARESGGGIVVQSGAAAGATKRVKAVEETSFSQQAADETIAASASLPEESVNTIPASDENRSADLISEEHAAEVNTPATITPENPERISVGTPQLSSRPLALLPRQENYPEMKRRHRVQPEKEGSFRAAPRHRLQTEFLFGVAYANQHFSVADEANRPLLSEREISEYPEASYQVTLRTNYRISEHLLFTGGLTYAEIRNQLEYQQVVNGLTTDVIINNSIRLLEAPLLLGYRLPGRRLHVALNAGPVINLSTSARGRFLSPDAPQPLALAVAGNYRRHIGIGLMTSLSTTYRIGEKDPFLLVVEPFFKTYPGAFTVKDAPLREKYWVAGLQLGVRKEF